LIYQARVLKIVLDDLKTGVQHQNHTSLTRSKSKENTYVGDSQDEVVFETNKASIQTIWAEPP